MFPEVCMTSLNIEAPAVFRPLYQPAAGASLLMRFD
jgi:hypothetical protein